MNDADALMAYQRMVREGEITDSYVERRAFFVGWDAVHHVRAARRLTNEAGSDAYLLGFTALLIAAILTGALVMLWGSGLPLIAERVIYAPVVVVTLCVVGFLALRRSARASRAARVRFDRTWNGG